MGHHEVLTLELGLLAMLLLKECTYLLISLWIGYLATLLLEVLCTYHGV